MESNNQDKQVWFDVASGFYNPNILGPWGYLLDTPTLTVDALSPGPIRRKRAASRSLGL